VGLGSLVADDHDSLEHVANLGRDLISLAPVASYSVRVAELLVVVDALVVRSGDCNDITRAVRLPLGIGTLRVHNSRYSHERRYRREGEYNTEQKGDSA
jgi:hypothetical protein